MHKIDLFPHKINIRRFVLMQIVLIMFVILFTYKWAYTVTHIIEQNIVMNLVYGCLLYTSDAADDTPCYS